MCEVLEDSRESGSTDDVDRGSTSASLSVSGSTALRRCRTEEGCGATIVGSARCEASGYLMLDAEEGKFCRIEKAAGKVDEGIVTPKEVLVAGKRM